MNFIFKHTIFWYTIALFSGGIYKPLSMQFNSYIGVLCMAIYFLAFIQVNLDSLRQAIKSIPWLMIWSFVLMIMLPIMFYLGFDYLSIYDKNLSYFGLALLFFRSVACATGSPGLSRTLNGDYALSLLMLIFTSLLMTVSLPLIVNYIADVHVKVSILVQLEHLFYLIGLPLILAMPIRLMPSFIKYMGTTMHGLEVCCLICIFIGIGQGSLLLALQQLDLSLWYFILSGFAFVVMAGIGLLLSHKNHAQDISSCVGAFFANFGLAAFFSDRWLGSIDQVTIAITLLSFWVLITALILPKVLKAIKTRTTSSNQT